MSVILPAHPAALIESMFEDFGALYTADGQRPLK
jgi:hypothetical protein